MNLVLYNNSVHNFGWNFWCKSIPLLDINGRFEMYSIYNLAINSEKISKSHGININMLAQYALETNCFAVNQRKTEYLILNPGDVNSCSQGLQIFVKLNCL
jgi:hypothetical protein